MQPQQHIPVPIAPTWIKSTLMSLAMILAGCSTTMESLIPNDGHDMKSIYEHHMDSQNTTKQPSIKGRPPGTGDADLAGYTRTANNEIQAIFPVLPNPVLVMYVFPHLSEDGAPVPGYATSFPMYDKLEYALPGEVAP